MTIASASSARFCSISSSSFARASFVFVHEVLPFSSAISSFALAICICASANSVANFALFLVIFAISSSFLSISAFSSDTSAIFAPNLIVFDLSSVKSAFNFAFSASLSFNAASLLMLFLFASFSASVIFSRSLSLSLIMSPYHSSAFASFSLRPWFSFVLSSTSFSMLLT